MTRLMKSRLGSSGVLEHEHVAAVNLLDRQHPGGRGRTEAKLIHEQVIANEQVILHGCRGNLERLHHERTDEQREDDGGDDRLEIFADGRIFEIGYVRHCSYVGRVLRTRLNGGSQPPSPRLRWSAVAFRGGGKTRPTRYRCPSSGRPECFLRDLDLPDLLHPLLAFFLLLEQLALAGDVAAVTLREHVLAHRLDRFARDDRRRSPPESRPRTSAAESASRIFDAALVPRW